MKNIVKFDSRIWRIYLFKKLRVDFHSMHFLNVVFLSVVNLLFGFGDDGTKIGFVYLFNNMLRSLSAVCMKTCQFKRLINECQRFV